MQCLYSVRTFLNFLLNFIDFLLCELKCESDRCFYLVLPFLMVLPFSLKLKIAKLDSAQLQQFSRISHFHYPCSDTPAIRFPPSLTSPFSRACLGILVEGVCKCILSWSASWSLNFQCICVARSLSAVYGLQFIEALSLCTIWPFHCRPEWCLWK